LAWVAKQYTDAEVNRAGETLVAAAPSPAEYDYAIEVIDNFRAAHSFPLNTFQARLRTRAPLFDQTALVSQRLKRVPAIRAKLARERSMKLSRMQDLGGCRAVVESCALVYALMDDFGASGLKHDLVGFKDYISHPKSSGYRGVHLVYRYHSDRKQAFNGLRIEVQLRSYLQHAWATAVETVGSMTAQALKTGGGEADWARFFQLMATVIALQEGTPPIGGTPEGTVALVAELRVLNDRLRVVTKLRAYANAVRYYQESGAAGSRHFVLVIRPADESVAVTGFKASEFDAAYAMLREIERGLQVGPPGSEAVLVSVDSLEAARAAYPSYFANAESFIAVLNGALARDG
jgi:hypothetical protein